MIKSTLFLLLFAAFCSCAPSHLQVHTEPIMYLGYERHQRGAGYVYFLQWTDTRGGAQFWSVQDSLPRYPKGFLTTAYLNF